MELNCQLSIKILRASVALCLKLLDLCVSVPSCQVIEILNLLASLIVQEDINLCGSVPPCQVIEILNLLSALAGSLFRKT